MCCIFSFSLISSFCSPSLLSYSCLLFSSVSQSTQGLEEKLLVGLVVKHDQCGELNLHFLLHHNLREEGGLEEISV